MKKQIEAGGKRFDVVQHADGKWALSEEGSPSAVEALGTLDEVERYVDREYGSPTWLS